MYMYFNLIYSFVYFLNTKNHPKTSPLPYSSLFMQGVEGGDLEDLEEGKVGKVLAMLQTFYNQLQDSQIKTVSLYTIA